MVDLEIIIRATGDFPAKAIAFFKVGWDQLASSAGPPSGSIENSRWAYILPRFIKALALFSGDLRLTG